MPPQGLLLIAAYMPESWPVRFIDENIARATRRRFRLGRRGAGQRHARPGAADPRHPPRAPRRPARSVVLGGPSVSAAPEMYPDIDYLHIGELGDATDALIARLDESVAPPAAQMRFETSERLPLRDFPIPAYDLIPLKRYLMLTAAVLERLPLSLRVLRHPGPLRPPAAAEDAGADHRRARRHAPADRHPPVVYFVDDNFIGNRKADARDAAASRRLAEAARLSAAVRLRGDAQHRQADRRSSR